MTNVLTELLKAEGDKVLSITGLAPNFFVVASEQGRFFNVLFVNDTNGMAQERNLGDWDQAKAVEVFTKIQAMQQAQAGQASAAKAQASDIIGVRRPGLVTVDGLDISTEPK